MNKFAFFGFVAVVLLYIFAFVYMDLAKHFEADRYHKLLQTLKPGDVSSIVIGHQLLDGSEKIHSIVAVLKNNTPFYKWPAYHYSNTLHIRLMLTLKDGRTILCSIIRSWEHSNSAILEFGYLPPAHLYVDGLVDVLDNAGAHVPYGGDVDLSDDGKVLKLTTPSDTSNKMPTHTLYDIQRSRCLAAPEVNSNLILIVESCMCLLIGLAMVEFALVYFKKGVSEIRKLDFDYPKERTGRLFTYCFVIVLLSAIAWLVPWGITEFNKAYDYHLALSKALAEGKCKNICGKLTDVRYIYEDHGAVYLRVIKVDGHSFLFPTTEVQFDQYLYDATGWEGLAPDQLQLGAPVSVWYTTIEGWNYPDEHVARIDIR